MLRTLVSQVVDCTERMKRVGEVRKENRQMHQSHLAELSYVMVRIEANICVPGTSRTQEIKAKIKLGEDRFCRLCRALVVLLTQKAVPWTVQTDLQQMHPKSDRLLTD